MMTGRLVGVALATILGAGLCVTAQAQDKRTFTFAYDQPKPTAYGFTGDLFERRLGELSNGTLAVNQFPGAQLGQEPQALQKMRAGDIDFVITSTANGATLSPQLGVLSIHFLFANEAHLVKAIGSKELNDEVRALVEETVQGAHALTLMTLGLRNIYSKHEVTKVDDFNARKVRVQATKTEDTMFPVYGALPVHMPFGDVYTSLQTGVVDMAENGVNVYFANKHYEVAPVMSLTQHEANCNMLWVSDKTWSSLTPEQQGWVRTIAGEIAQQEPTYALGLEAQSADKLKKLGVKLVENVDRTGMIKVAEPIQDQLAKELGPHAVRIVEIVRGMR